MQLKKKQICHIGYKGLVILLAGVMIFGVAQITKTPVISISDLENLKFDYKVIGYQSCYSLRIRPLKGAINRKILSWEEVGDLFGNGLQELSADYFFEAFQEVTEERKVYEISLRFYNELTKQEKERSIDIEIVPQEALDESFRSGKRYRYKNIELLVYSYRESDNSARNLRVSFRYEGCGYMIWGVSADEEYVRKMIEYLINHPIKNVQNWAM